MRPRDLSGRLTELIASAAGNPGFFTGEPLTKEMFAQIRLETWKLYDEIRVKLEKEAEATVAP